MGIRETGVREITGRNLTRLLQFDCCACLLARDASPCPTQFAMGHLRTAVWDCMIPLKAYQTLQLVLDTCHGQNACFDTTCVVFAPLPRSPPQLSGRLHLLVLPAAAVHRSLPKLISRACCYTTVKCSLTSTGHFELVFPLVLIIPLVHTHTHTHTHTHRYIYALSFNQPQCVHSFFKTH
jgi:hypothetical protein